MNKDQILSAVVGTVQTMLSEGDVEIHAKEMRGLDEWTTFPLSNGIEVRLPGGYVAEITVKVTKIGVTG